MNLLVGGVAILCFTALVFVPWDEETIAPKIVNTPVEKIVSDIDEFIINNFEECIAEGNPAMESYPRQCRTVDGQHFVENIDEPWLDSSYPDVCIAPQYPPGLDCGDIEYSNFKVIGNDPHGFDVNNDGIGCESWKFKSFTLKLRHNGCTSMYVDVILCT